MSDRQGAHLFCLPLKQKEMPRGVFVGIVLGYFALGVPPAIGQVASYVNEHGKRIYVNAPARVSRKPAAPLRKGKVTFGPGLAGTAGSRLGGPRTQWVSGRGVQPPKEGLERMVNQMAERHRVDPALIKAVIDAESNWNPWAVSHKGALGLMQLVPGTAQRLGVMDPFDAEQNLDGGVRYLRMLLERYHGDLDLALAAYNAGENAVDRARGVPGYRETRNYVQKVTQTYFRPDSGRLPELFRATRPVRRTVDERGRVVYTND